MLTRIAAGHILDPATARDQIGDLWVHDGRIVEPSDDARPDETVDAAGLLVMAGAIDIHSHIAGANVNTARLLLPEEHRASEPRPAHTPLSTAGWSTFATGVDYARMGFTTVVEPAVSPHHALHAHLELADTPIIDKAILAILGNDDYLLRLIREGGEATHVADYVAWTLDASQALGIKLINAGAAAAFKANMRAFSLDDEVPWYGATSRQIMKTLQRAVRTTRVPHPLHVHCNNLGIAGSGPDSLIATIEAAEGLPMHLAHIQFYAYGTEGDRRFSSAAARIAEVVNAHKHVSVDVGQVMFGQTVTVSSDVMRQYSSLSQASPKKWSIFDGDANGGGIVPYRYGEASFANAVQWAAGLELFLLIEDAAQVYFTTDHPNGAPFHTYPDIFALLMSRELRAEWIARLPAAAIAATTLPSITREYTLQEIAVMTRQAPARLLGLRDRGHLGAGAVADIAAYRPGADKAAMFRRAALVFKDGELVVRDGEVVRYRWGKALTVRPPADPAIERRMHDYYGAAYGLDSSLLKVPEWAVGRDEPFEAVPCSA